MSELTSTKKIEWLQIMRGLATIFVVFGHIVLLKYQSDSVDLISGIIYLFISYASIFCNVRLFIWL